MEEARAHVEWDGHRVVIEWTIYRELIPSS